mgnify:CR=1 FL=1
MSDVTAAIIDRLRTLEGRLAALERREWPYTAIGARVYNGGAFTHNSSGNWLSITFDSERFDTDGIHSTSSNAERLTCVTPGTYLITGTALWTASGDGTARGLRIMVGSTRIASEMRALPSTSVAPGITISAIYQLTAGQYVTLDAYQNTGGSLDIVAYGNYSPEFSMVRIA